MNKAKKILVTGATGFVGANLTRELVRLGYKVRILCRKGSSHPFLRDLNIEIFTGDVNDRKSLLEATAGCDVVFHTVGNMSFWYSDRPLQYKINVEGTENIVYAAKQNGVAKFIFTSTVNTLGIPEVNKVGDEETDYNWQPIDFYYSATKKNAEDIVLKAADNFFQVVVCNPGTIFGVGDIHQNGGEYVIKIAKGLRYFVPRGGTNCVSVESVIDGHIRAMEYGKSGQKYILGGQNLSYLELFKLIGRKLGIGFHPVWQVPYTIALITALINEKVLKLVNGKSQVTPEAVRAGYLNLHYSSAKAERELGYKVLSIDNAIDETILFYRETGILK